jgi:hypothetical protein
MWLQQSAPPTQQSSLGVVSSPVSSPKKFQKPATLLFLRRLFLGVALVSTAVELFFLWPQVQKKVDRRNVFIYTERFPQAATYSPDGSHIVVATPEVQPLGKDVYKNLITNVDLFDAKTGQKIRRLFSIAPGTAQFSYSKNGNNLFFKNSNFLFKYGKNQELTPVFEDQKFLSSSLNSKTNHVVGIQKDKIVKIDLESGRILQSAPIALKELSDFQVYEETVVSEDERFVLWKPYNDKKSNSTMLYTKYIYLTDLESRKNYKINSISSVGSMSLSGPSIYNTEFVMISPDGNMVFIKDNVVIGNVMREEKNKKTYTKSEFVSGIIAFDLKKGKIIKSIQAAIDLKLKKIDKKGNLWVTDGNSDFLFNWKSMESYRTVDTLYSIPPMAISPDGRWQVRQSRHGLIREPVPSKLPG